MEQSSARAPVGRGLGAILIAATALGELAGCPTPGADRVRAVLERGRIDLALGIFDREARETGSPRDAAGLLRLVAIAVVEREAASDDAAMRDEAFLALRRRNGETARALERLARSTRRATAIRAQSDLYERGAGGDAAVLSVALGSADPEDRVAAVVVLRDLDGPAVERLRALFADTDDRVRRAAVGVCGRRPLEGRPAEALAGALRDAARHDPSAAVRAGALRAIAAWGPSAPGGPGPSQGTEFLAVLREALADPDVGVRLAAVTVIASLTPLEAGTLLGPLLAGEPRPESVQAAFEMARLGDPSAVDYLIAALGVGSPASRGEAAILGGELGGDRVGQALHEALAAQTVPEVRFQIAVALLRFGTEAAREGRAALRNLATDDGWIGLQAALRLASSGSRRARSRLRTSLRDPDPAVRARVARGLAGGRGVRDPELVRLALGDEDRRVQIAAADAALGLVD